MNIYQLSTLGEPNFTTIERDSIEDKTLISNVEKGNIQFITKDSIELNLKTDIAVNAPDIFTSPLPLISNEVKELFDKLGIDYIFYKPVYLYDDFFDEKTLYWLAVIPKIQCMNPEKEENVIGHVGKFMIFRIKESSGAAIYVTDQMKEILESNKFKGILFTKYKY